MAIWTEELLGRLRNLSSAAAPQKILRLKWEAESSKNAFNIAQRNTFNILISCYATIKSKQKARFRIPTVGTSSNLKISEN